MHVSTCFTKGQGEVNIMPWKEISSYGHTPSPSFHFPVNCSPKIYIFRPQFFLFSNSPPLRHTEHSLTKSLISLLPSVPDIFLVVTFFPLVTFHLTRAKSFTYSLSPVFITVHVQSVWSSVSVAHNIRRSLSVVPLSSLFRRIPVLQDLNCSGTLPCQFKLASTIKEQDMSALTRSSHCIKVTKQRRVSTFDSSMLTDLHYANAPQIYLYM